MPEPTSEISASFAVRKVASTRTTLSVLNRQTLSPFEFEQVCRIFVRIALRIQEREKQATQEKDTNIPKDEEPV